MTEINGDPAGLRSQARVWGRQAQAAETQAGRLRSAAATIGVDKFRGAAGDAMRNYVEHLAGAASTVADAYDQLSAAAPRVAEAIEDAKQAEQKRDDARTTLTTATAQLVAAEAAYAAAVAAAAASSVVHAVAGGPASVARQAVTQAKARVDRARTAVDTAQRKLKAAQTAFEHADTTRTRLSSAFAALVRKQGAEVQGAVAATPPPPQASPLAHDLNVLGIAKTVLKIKLDLTTDAIKRSVEDIPGLYDKVDGVSKGIGRASLVLGIGTSTVLALAQAKQKHLTGQQTQDYVFNHVLLENGLGVAGGLLCAEGGPVASAACGYAGGRIGGVLEKSRTLRDVTDLYSHDVLNPVLAPVRDLTHGNVLDAGRDLILTEPKVALNGAKSALTVVTHPQKLVKVAGDVGHDAKGVGAFLDHINPISPSKVEHALLSIP